MAEYLAENAETARRPTPEPPPATAPNPYLAPAGDGLALTATVLVLAGLALVAWGLYATFKTVPEIVGGDAYNYLIGAIRGVGLICAGLGVIGCALVCAVASARARLSDLVRP